MCHWVRPGAWGTGEKCGLRTLDDSLGPKAAATNRESISAAILLVLLKERAPAARVTRRKQEAPNLLPETGVFVGVPNLVEVAGAGIAKGIG